MKRLLGIVIMSCFMLGLSTSVVRAEILLDAETDFYDFTGSVYYETYWGALSAGPGSAGADISIPVDGLYDVSAYVGIGWFVNNELSISVDSGTDVITEWVEITLVPPYDGYYPHKWVYVGTLYMRAGDTMLRVSSGAAIVHVGAVSVNLLTPVAWPFLDAEAGDFTCADGAYIETYWDPDAINSGVDGGSAEADISIPVDGDYEIALYMGNLSPRSIDISIDGDEVISDFYGVPTGSWNPDTWCVAGVVYIAAGDSVLTLSTDGLFPHVGAVSLRLATPVAAVVLDVEAGDFTCTEGSYVETWWVPDAINGTGKAVADFSVSTGGFYEVSVYTGSLWERASIHVSIDGEVVNSEFFGDATGSYDPSVWFVAGVVYIPAGDSVLTLQTVPGISGPYTHHVGIVSLGLMAVPLLAEDVFVTPKEINLSKSKLTIHVVDSSGNLDATEGAEAEVAINGVFEGVIAWLSDPEPEGYAVQVIIPDETTSNVDGTIDIELVSIGSQSIVMADGSAVLVTQDVKVLDRQGNTGHGKAWWK